MIAYEEALKTCDPSVRLAYWDIAIDSQAPAKSEIFSDRFFGGNGNLAQGNCVQVGQFAGRMNVYPKYNCLRRDFDLGQFLQKGDSEATIGAHFAPHYLIYERQQGRARTFDYFRNFLESTVHEAVHFGVGGANGDMSKADTAANDPVFWLHHRCVFFCFN